MPAADRTGSLPLASARIGLVGFGEVGRIFGAALVRAGAARVLAWDKLFAAGEPGARARGRAREAGVDACDSLASLLATSDWLFSAVTADQTLAVASEAAPLARPGTVFVDLTSASPGTKTACAELLGRAGVRYVEAAVMSSVPPHGLKVPMLLGGPHAAQAGPILGSWGLDATAVSAEWGVASAIKMCRSVIVKGMEALVIESFTAARAYGVEAAVLASLEQTFPGIDWDVQADYFFGRVIAHGARRAQEMAEAAVTMSEAGIGGCMASATSRRQAWVASLARDGAFDAAAADWRARADAALATRASRCTDEG